jgi:hypothetical protein
MAIAMIADKQLIPIQIGFTAIRWGMEVLPDKGHSPLHPHLQPLRFKLVLV